jgi:endonuclease/exonuclease/phosphatase (EEP) superfamily protein YafD
MSFAIASRHGFWTAVLLLALATAMALVPLPWPMSLAEHFHLHYLAAAAVAALVAAALRQVTLADACAVIALVNLVVVAPHLRAGAPVAASGATRVRVLLLNVHTASMQHAQVRQLIDDVAPDVVALVEVDRRWLDALETSLRDYRGRLEKPRDDNFGIALYHRQPLLAGEIAAIGSSLPSVVARLDTGGAPLAVILTHPIPPVDVATARANRAQLDAIGDRARHVRRAHRARRFQRDAVVAPVRRPGRTQRAPRQPRRLRRGRLVPGRAGRAGDPDRSRPRVRRGRGHRAPHRARRRVRSSARGARAGDRAGRSQVIRGSSPRQKFGIIAQGREPLLAPRERLIRQRSWATLATRGPARAAKDRPQVEPSSTGTGAPQQAPTPAGASTLTFRGIFGA